MTKNNETHRFYLFDFDGTLVNSMPYWSQKMINILEKSKIKYPDDIIKTVTPLGDLGTAKYFREVLGVDFSIDEMLSLMDDYALPKYRDEIQLKDGVYDYLKLLKKSDFGLNILTASPHKMLDPCLKRNGIYDLFDNVWSCDDFGTTKSDVEIYKSAAAKIGAKESDIAFFDDNICAIETAKQAGLYTVGVYDDSAKDFCEQLKTVSDLYILSFDGLDII